MIKWLAGFFIVTLLLSGTHMFVMGGTSSVKGWVIFVPIILLGVFFLVLLTTALVKYFQNRKTNSDAEVSDRDKKKSSLVKKTVEFATSKTTAIIVILMWIALHIVCWLLFPDVMRKWIFEHTPMFIAFQIVALMVAFAGFKGEPRQLLTRAAMILIAIAFFFQLTTEDQRDKLMDNPWNWKWLKKSPPAQPYVVSTETMNRLENAQRSTATMEMISKRIWSRTIWVTDDMLWELKSATPHPIEVICLDDASIVRVTPVMGPNTFTRSTNVKLRIAEDASVDSAIIAITMK